MFLKRYNQAFPRTAAISITYDGNISGNEVVQVASSESDSVPQFVTEESIALYAQNIQIDISPYRGKKKRMFQEETQEFYFQDRGNLPCDMYAHNANLRASVPHSGIPFG